MFKALLRHHVLVIFQFFCYGFLGRTHVMLKPHKGKGLLLHQVNVQIIPLRCCKQGVSSHTKYMWRSCYLIKAEKLFSIWTHFVRQRQRQFLLLMGYKIRVETVLIYFRKAADICKYRKSQNKPYLIPKWQSECVAVTAKVLFLDFCILLFLYDSVRFFF